MLKDTKFLQHILKSRLFLLCGIQKVAEVVYWLPEKKKNRKKPNKVKKLREALCKKGQITA